MSNPERPQEKLYLSQLNVGDWVEIACVAAVVVSVFGIIGMFKTQGVDQEAYAVFFWLSAPGILLLLVGILVLALYVIVVLAASVPFWAWIIIALLAYIAFK